MYKVIISRVALLNARNMLAGEALFGCSLETSKSACIRIKHRQAVLAMWNDKPSFGLLPLKEERRASRRKGSWPRA
jgi:hypothetical protein